MATRPPLYFTADVSILLLLFFSPSNLGGLWADRHQTLPHVSLINAGVLRPMFQ